MGGKTAIAGGLVAGLAAGALLVGLVVVYGPGATTPVSSPVASAGPSPSGSPTVVASPSPEGSPSAGASADPSPVASGSAAPGDAAFGVGEPAPPLAVPQLGGGEITLSALRGKPVWVNFMATWCPPCRDEMPRMNAFAARYAEQGLVVVAVDVREDEALVDAFAKELGVAFPVGIDRDGTAQSDWGAFALPVHFWVDASGVVRDGALGGIGPDIMAQGLQTILPDVAVTP